MSVSENTYLKVDNINKAFAGVRAVQDVSFSINRGEIRALIGENGSGKSTMIKMIAGVYQPDSGSITIKGRRYTRLTTIDAIRSGVQVIYQDFSLFPNLTVAENLAINDLLQQNKFLVNWRNVRSIAQLALDKIGVPIDLDKLVSNLPVSDRQLIAIARALLQDAEFIIMDEPTTTLTQNEVETLFEVVRRLAEGGISILFVSHKLSEVEDIADTIMVLRNGCKVADGPASEFDSKSMAVHMTGREIVDSGYQFTGEPQATPLLTLKNLTRAGSFRDVNLDIRRGEIIGITGLLGSGRTELAMALFGVEPATSGEIWIDGKQVQIKSINDAIKYNIAYVPEDRLTQGLFLERSISDNMIATILNRLSNPLGFLSKQAIDKTVNKWIKKLSVKTPSADMSARNLSGGNQQRVVIAKWLASDPKLLVLNGPTVGVDIGSKQEIHQAIKELARDGMSIIVISDDIPELFNTCNRIHLMKEGRMTSMFNTVDITQAELNATLKEKVDDNTRPIPLVEEASPR